jgi:hypothetical protein
MLRFDRICIRRPQLWTTFILEGADERRLGISAKSDGVRTFCDILMRIVEPTAIHPSGPKQMVDLH